MPPSEFIRVEHNVNGKIVTDPVEFANLQYQGDGHTSVSKGDDSRPDSRKRKSRRRRHKHPQRTNTPQQSAPLPEPSPADIKSLQDAIDKDHRRMENL